MLCGFCFFILFDLLCGKLLHFLFFGLLIWKLCIFLFLVGCLSDKRLFFFPPLCVENIHYLDCFRLCGKLLLCFVFVAYGSVLFFFVFLSRLCAVCYCVLHVWPVFEMGFSLFASLPCLCNGFLPFVFVPMRLCYAFVNSLIILW